MLKFKLQLCGIAMLVLSVSSCILDPPPGDPPVTPPPNKNLQPLTTKEAVLNNIEVAYNTRNTTAYDDLLGDNFTFYFAPGDVGGEIPEQWDRGSETRSANCLFTSKDGPPIDCPQGPQCRSIRMDLQYDNVQWVASHSRAIPGRNLVHDDASLYVHLRNGARPNLCQRG